MDLGERKPYSPVLTGAGDGLPRNEANNLHSSLTTNPNFRNSSLVQNELTTFGLLPVQDFEKTFIFRREDGQLSDAGKGSHRIERYTIEPLPRDAVSDGNSVNLEAVAEAIKRAWKRFRTPTKFVAMALPAAAVITKKIVVPAGQRETELEMLVESEANQYIKIKLNDFKLWSQK